MLPPCGRAWRGAWRLGGAPACRSATLYSTQEDPIGLAGGLNLYGYAGGDPVNRHDPFGLRDTVIADEKARAAVTECAQVDVCKAWLAYLAQDPRTFTIRSGVPTDPRNLGETDLKTETGTFMLTGADILIDADFGDIKRRGQTPGGVLAHELGGHVMGTVVYQHWFPGFSGICGDANPARVGKGCAESQRLKWEQAKKAPK
jgi:hypothetical protein